MQRSLLRRLDIHCAGEPPADLFLTLQAEVADRSPLHLQLQDATGLGVSHAAIAHIHMQDVWSSAVEGDLAFVFCQMNLVASILRKLECLIAYDIWGERERKKCGNEKDRMTKGWIKLQFA